MKLSEYLEKLQKSSIFRSVLPMNQGVLYPLFSVVNEKLCTHFITHRTEFSDEGLKVYYPEFYMVFTYPGCALVKFERLACSPDFAGEDFDSYEVMRNFSAEEASVRKKEIKDVLKLAENIFDQWDSSMIADAEMYNSAYFKLLTEKQQEVLNKLRW